MMDWVTFALGAWILAVLFADLLPKPKSWVQFWVQITLLGPIAIVLALLVVWRENRAENDS